MIKLPVSVRIKLRQALTLVLLSGAILAMFPFSLPACDWWAGHAQWVAVAYLLLGIIFLIFNRFRLMFVCFGCSAAISFFYHESQLKPKKPDTQSYFQECAPGDYGSKGWQCGQSLVFDDLRASQPSVTQQS
ncbi:MAG: hypothetical protein U0U46_04105 [Saprospiraceae bacterium]